MIILANTSLPWEAIVGFVAGGLAVFWFLRYKDKAAKDVVATEGRLLMENARREAEALKREARLSASEELLKQREDQEKVLSIRRKEMAEAEDKLVRRENQAAQQMEAIGRREKEIEEQQRATRQHEEALAARQQELAELVKERREKLERISHLSAVTAREELMKQVEQEAAQDANQLYRRTLQEIRERADEKARRIVSIAIQRYAGTLTFESTTATLTLPNEEIKGRIIGREGRNIRAFENATGVTVLIDDTPNAVVLSGFDPVRREIAREAMHRLIQDGRIHPTRIEEVVGKVSQEMEEAIQHHGDEALQRTGVNGLQPEIVKLLGRLHYRHSFSQNILEHSVEVAHLMGLMAAELGLDIALSKRAGLLHDIGKAVDHEIEGAHAVVGAEVLKQHGEPEVIVNAVAAHHGDVPGNGPISALLAAADAISASRPGARSETLTVYLKRVENLERLGMSFPGVDKCFAVQAGREVRVLVHPSRVNDDQAMTLARDISRRIETELQYPGQIRVVVMRETRCVEFAK